KRPQGRGQFILPLDDEALNKASRNMILADHTLRWNRAMSRALDINDLKTIARRRVPKMFFDYADSGAWTEGTYRANEEDFRKIKLRQRVLVDMSNRSLETTMIGEKVSMPVALAPTGMTGMQHPDGEILAAQAAEEFGVPFTLSTMAICSIEDVAEHTT